MNDDFSSMADMPAIKIIKSLPHPHCRDPHAVKITQSLPDFYLTNNL